MNAPTDNNSVVDHVTHLDGLRGLASLWVLLSHVQILSGLRAIPVLSWGNLAVDLFMMLSGFLMAHHYIGRAQREPWNQPATAFIFWVRRFFRIAPLYYLVLAVALALGPAIGEFRDEVARYWPHTATSPDRYNDHGFANVLLHVSFLFGFIPSYAFRTPLPDWSIGLEMQFYALFPFLMLGMGRWGAFRFGWLAIAGCIVFRWVMPGHFSQWQMPAFIPMKLTVFLIGMWMAVGRHYGRYLMAFCMSLLAALLLAVMERSVVAVFRLVLVVVLFYLLTDGTLFTNATVDSWIARMRRALSGRLARFAGDTSYAVYLVHLLILIPLAGWLTRFPAYLAASAWMRFALCAAVLICAAYPLAWLLYRTVETQGIQWGKTLIVALRPQPKPAVKVLND